MNKTKFFRKRARALLFTINQKPGKKIVAVAEIHQKKEKKKKVGVLLFLN